jgi:hypothetical protein
VIGIPPSADLRKALEQTFKQKFGIELEITQASGGQTARKIADKFHAGVRYLNLSISAVDNLMDRLLPMGASIPLSPTGSCRRSEILKAGGAGIFGLIRPSALPILQLRTCWIISGTTPTS